MRNVVIRYALRHEMTLRPPLSSRNGALGAVSGIFTSIVSFTIPDSRKRLPG